MDTELLNRLKHCKALPSLPGVAVRIIELGQDLEASITDLARLVSLDPALSAKILRIANSSLYVRRRFHKSNDLRQALLVLGMDAALALALSFSLVRSLRRDEQAVMDYDLYWRRSILAAASSRTLGEEIGLGDQADLFLAGLLQDIGMLALARAIPERYRLALTAQANHLQLEEAEREHLHTDHIEVGVWLLKTWQLPEHIPVAVAGSHYLETIEIIQVPKDRQSFVRCVALSGLLADLWLTPHRKPILRALIRQAKTSLNINREVMSKVMAKVMREMADLAELFEIRLVEGATAEMMLEEAQEILMIRRMQAS